MVGERSRDSFKAQLTRALTSSQADDYGRLLEQFRGWLLLLARLEIDGPLQAKLDPADLVQETLLHAYRDRASFRGSTEPELAGWLRSILAHVIGNEVRRFKGRKMRDVELEVSLEQRIEQNLERSSAGLAGALAASDPSPSARAVKEEEGILLAGAIMSLPEDYREVIVLRSLKGLSHDEVARRMEKSPGAVRMLWLRALARLKEEARKWNR